jgi:hypothetical protein
MIDSVEAQGFGEQQLVLVEISRSNHRSTVEHQALLQEAVDVVFSVSFWGRLEYLRTTAFGNEGGAGFVTGGAWRSFQKKTFSAAKHECEALWMQMGPS